MSVLKNKIKFDPMLHIALYPHISCWSVYSYHDLNNRWPVDKFVIIGMGKDYIYLLFFSIGLLGSPSILVFWVEFIAIFRIFFLMFSVANPGFFNASRRQKGLPPYVLFHENTENNRIVYISFHTWWFNIIGEQPTLQLKPSDWSWVTELPHN